ncbi:TPA: hypothetical protein ACH3X1_010164 [Trebouxia sp. C0004]
MILLQSVLFGWLWVNVFASMPEDVLHQDFDGLGKLLLECIYLYIERQTKAEASRLKGMILEHMLYIRKLHGINVPSQGLDTEHITAEDIQNFGMTDLTTTGPKERFNKDIKRAARNFKPGNTIAQVA